MNTVSQPIISPEAEQLVLGAILRDGALAFDRVQAILVQDDFAEEIHRRIFDVIARLSADGKSPTIVQVKPWLGDGDLGGQTVGGYLARLVAEGGDLFTLASHARTIRELADRRRVFDVGAVLQAQAASIGLEGKAAEIASDGISALDTVMSKNTAPAKRRIGLGEAAEAAADASIARQEGDNVPRILTGIGELDNKIGDLRAGRTTILAGRSSMGKSATLIQIAANVAQAGYGVLIFSLEMTSEECANRALAMVSARCGRGVPFSRIEAGNIDHAEKSALRTAAASLKAFVGRCEIDPDRTLTAQMITARARKVKADFDKRGIKLALVAIDHVGKVTPSNRYSGNRVMEVAEVSAAARELAQELDTHVVLLAQINRDTEKMTNKRPMMSHLRESGSLEQDHDNVLAVYREAYYQQNLGTMDGDRLAEEYRHTLELLVLKNRQGPRGVVTLYTDMALNVIRSPRAADGLPEPLEADTAFPRVAGGTSSSRGSGKRYSLAGE